MGRWLLIVLALVTATACAGIEIKKGRKDNAIVYYLPDPYLLIAPNGKDGALLGQIIYLPNCSEARSIRPTAGIGSVTFEPTLENGWNLTGFDSSIDSQSDEFLTALTSLAASAIGEPVQGAELFQLLFDGNGVSGFRNIEIPGTEIGTSCHKVE